MRVSEKLTKCSKYLQLDSKDRWILAFGKHSGSFLDDVVSEDKEYLEWLIEQDIPDPVREIVEMSMES